MRPRANSDAPVAAVSTNAALAAPGEFVYQRAVCIRTGGRCLGAERGCWPCAPSTLAMAADTRPRPMLACWWMFSAVTRSARNSEAG